MQVWRNISPTVQIELPWRRPRADYRKRTTLEKPFKTDRRVSCVSNTLSDEPFSK